MFFDTLPDRMNKLKMALLADKHPERKFNLSSVPDSNSLPPLSIVKLVVFGEKSYVKKEIQKINVLRLVKNGEDPLVFSLGKANFEKNYAEMSRFLERFGEKLTFGPFLPDKLVVVTVSKFVFFFFFSNFFLFCCVVML